ncbi:MAG: hypothetical protein HYR66_02440 [Sphingobacteriales bacterium]|nr:hypothetical protein [Sphingobacteriales bacterium]MBI3720587.1 hypothetical protein [Sphingobacteriales bacterium]
MKITVLGTLDQQEEFRKKNLPEATEIFFVSTVEALKNAASSFIAFDLSFEPSSERIELLSSLNKTVIINSVVNTLKGLGLPDNFIRINAWPGFLNREIAEVSIGFDAQKGTVQTIFQLLNWQYQLTPDAPGMLSARVIAMIINEAYFALGDEVSTKKEIDTAMKLGTNYPYGPFEWSEKIGLKNIYKLLHKLNSTSNRYNIAPLLEREALQ